MALVSLRQVLDHAAENQYGVPAFNVNNLEQVQAIMIVLGKEFRMTVKDALDGKEHAFPGKSLR